MSGLRGRRSRGRGPRGWERVEAGETQDPLKGPESPPESNPHSWFGGMGRGKPACAQTQVGTPRGRCDLGDQGHGPGYRTDTQTHECPHPPRRAPGDQGARQTQARRAQTRAHRRGASPTRRDAATRRHASPKASHPQRGHQDACSLWRSREQGDRTWRRETTLTASSFLQWLY